MIFPFLRIIWNKMSRLPRLAGDCLQTANKARGGHMGQTPRIRHFVTHRGGRQGYCRVLPCLCFLYKILRLASLAQDDNKRVPCLSFDRGKEPLRLTEWRNLARKRIVEQTLSLYPCLPPGGKVAAEPTEEGRSLSRHSEEQSDAGAQTYGRRSVCAGAAAGASEKDIEKQQLLQNIFRRIKHEKGI